MTGKGYLLKVGNTVFPNSLLAKGGYAGTPNRRQDKNSFTDGRGATNRKILPIKRTTVKIKTIDKLTFGQKLIIQSFFPNRDKVVAEVWNDEDNDYQIMVCYVPDITYTVDHVDSKGNFYYQSLEFEFIDYGGGNA